MKKLEFKRYIKYKKVFYRSFNILVGILISLILLNIYYKYNNNDENNLDIKNTQLISNTPRINNLEELNKKRPTYLLITKEKKII